MLERLFKNLLVCSHPVELVLGDPGFDQLRPQDLVNLRRLADALLQFGRENNHLLLPQHEQLRVLLQLSAPVLPPG